MTYMRHPDDDLNSLVTTLRANIEKLADAASVIERVACCLHRVGGGRA